MPFSSISALRSDTKNALRCSPAADVADAIDDICGDVDVSKGDELLVTGGSVGDASPTYNIGLSVCVTRFFSDFNRLLREDGAS